MVTPELVAAVAVTVAAILSGFGLWVGAVREERTWRREALVDTIVQILEASFASPGNDLMKKRRNGTLTADDRQGAADAHVRSLTALTRLRVLATVDVVAQAEKLQGAQTKASDLVLLDGQQVPDDDTWTRLMAMRYQLRQDLLDAARRDLKLGKAKVMEPI